MTLTEAMKEAYADPDLATVIHDTIEMNHPSFADGPLHFVCNVENDMVLGGVLHKRVGVTLTLTGFDDDGETQGQLTLDNVSGQLVGPLREAVKAGFPIQVVYRAYTDQNVVTPGEVRAGLILSKVSLNATSATGTLEPSSKHDTQAFPRLTYDPERYKALHGAA